MKNPNKLGLQRSARPRHSAPQTEGNVENVEAAVYFYGKAVKLNLASAICFCNGAMAFSKLRSYVGAGQDCEPANCIDPS